jgi:hypothetical protein
LWWLVKKGRIWLEAFSRSTNSNWTNWNKEQALRRQWFAGLSEPRAAPYDNKQISVEESNLFCNLLNCDEGKTEKRKKVNPAGYRTLLGKVAIRSIVNIVRMHCTSIRWQSTI